MKMIYNFNQNSKIVIKSDINSKIDFSIIEISKAKKKHIDKIIKIKYKNESNNVKIFG